MGCVVLCCVVEWTTRQKVGRSHDPHWEEVTARVDRLLRDPNAVSACSNAHGGLSRFTCRPVVFGLKATSRHIFEL
jgi:hypothetical protein